MYCILVHWYEYCLLKRNVALGCFSQASKKASNKRQRGGQKACSNVFSMFEQSQIQEFKEVRSMFSVFWNLTLLFVDLSQCGSILRKCNSYITFWLNCLILCFALKAFGCIDQDRDGVIKKQDLRETYGQLGIFFNITLYLHKLVIMVDDGGICMRAPCRKTER